MAWVLGSRSKFGNWTSVPSLYIAEISLNVTLNHNKQQQLLRPVFLNLRCLFPTFHPEYPSVFSRFYFAECSFCSFGHGQNIYQKCQGLIFKTKIGCWKSLKEQDKLSDIDYQFRLIIRIEIQNCFKKTIETCYLTANAMKKHQSSRLY